ncbi:MAG: hypothetical protein KAZ87_12125 [Spirochaetes bacterium]|nr:hypothetical protein [Spirochaetota bacterium]
MKYLILLISISLGTAAEYFLARRRKHLRLKTLQETYKKNSLFVFGNIPQDLVSVFSGFRILFLLIFWGCAIGLIMIDASEGILEQEILFVVSLPVLALIITFLSNIMINFFRNAGIYFMQDRLVFIKFSRKEVLYSEILQAVFKKPFAVSSGFLKIPIGSDSYIKIPIADLKKEPQKYQKLRSLLCEKYSIELPEI